MMVLTVVIAMILVLVFVAIYGGVIWLQINLSKREHWFPGLILPGAMILGAIVVMLGVVAYSIYTKSDNGANGFVIEYTTATSIQIILHMMTVFMVVSIPNVPLLLIYTIQRSKRKRMSEVDKMSI